MIGMARYPDKYFDLAIVDPPYGIGNFTQSDRREKHGNYKWNETIPDKKYFDELRRVSKERIIWGANYYNCFEGAAIVWDKLNYHPTMSRCEIASYSGQKCVDYFQYEWHGFVVKREDPNSFHPCAKPISLYKWLLKNYAKEGDKILDTHLGSGSSRIACYDGGFDFVGFEIDKDYFTAQELRFNNHIKQLVLFDNREFRHSSPVPDCIEAKPKAELFNDQT